MTEQNSDPDLYMTGELELSDLEFKISVIDVLKALMEEWTKCKNRWVMTTLRTNRKS